MEFKRIIFVVSWSFLLTVVTSVHALEIESPVEGQQIVIGTSLQIVVKPETGERIVEVIAGLEEIPYDAKQGAFVKEILIAKETAPGKAAFTVDALSETGEVITSNPRRLTFILPFGVEMKKIIVREDQLKLSFIRIGQVLNLRLSSLYSDGVIRP